MNPPLDAVAPSRAVLWLLAPSPGTRQSYVDVGGRVFVAAAPVDRWAAGSGSRAGPLASDRSAARVGARGPSSATLASLGKAIVSKRNCALSFRPLAGFDQDEKTPTCEAVRREAGGEEDRRRDDQSTTPAHAGTWP